MPSLHQSITHATAAPEYYSCHRYTRLLLMQPLHQSITHATATPEYYYATAIPEYYYSCHNYTRVLLDLLLMPRLQQSIITHATATPEYYYSFHRYICERTRPEYRTITHAYETRMRLL